MALTIPGIAHVAAWAVLGVGVAVVAVRQKDISDRLDRAEVARETASEAVEASAPKEVRALSERLAALEQKGSVHGVEAKKAQEDVRKVTADLTKVWGELLKTPVAGGKGGEFEGDVRSILDKYVMERQFREKLGKAAGAAIPKKPDYPVLAKALNLRPEQSDRFATDIHAIQTELFQLLQMPRQDGVVLMDEIQQAEQYPEGSPQRIAPFLKLMKLKIPETEETYFERAIALATGVKERTQEYFDKDQVELLNGTDLDWFGIKFPN